MTYKDVYKKFMIEYDKADISSSYPSLTIYEVATLLDKAMLALIAQKVTGNNPRRQSLDLDMKGVADLRQITGTVSCGAEFSRGNYENEFVININDDITPVLYILSVGLYMRKQLTNLVSDYREEPVQIIPQIYSDKFKKTLTNDPWIKHPVCYIDDSTHIHVFIGDNMTESYFDNNRVYLHVIIRPDLFTDFLITKDGTEDKSETEFPLSDTMCEELINLAIIFACRTVGDPRISTEMQTKSLES